MKSFFFCRSFNQSSFSSPSGPIQTLRPFLSSVKNLSSQTGLPFHGLHPHWVIFHPITPNNCHPGALVLPRHHGSPYANHSLWLVGMGAVEPTRCKGIKGWRKGGWREGRVLSRLLNLLFHRFSLHWLVPYKHWASNSNLYMLTGQQRTFGAKRNPRG